MEITRGYLHTLKFAVPETATSISYTVKRGTETIKTANATQVAGVVSVAMPFVSVEETLQLELKFFVASVETIIYQDVVVVSSYVSLLFLKKVMPDDDDETRWAAESVVRNIINSVCGQSFGYRRTTLWAYPAGSRLELPEKLDSIITFNGRAAASDLSYDGSFISGASLAYLEIKHAPPDYVLDTVIRTPFYWHTNPVPVLIDGYWGYKNVPTPINLAAKILIEEYACKQGYRDKYIQSFAQEGWRVQFNSRAFESTGNVKADQLIEPFTQLGIVVV